MNSAKENSNLKTPIVLAFSGGLDTSYCEDQGHSRPVGRRHEQPQQMNE